MTKSILPVAFVNLFMAWKDFFAIFLRFFTFSPLSFKLTTTGFNNIVFIIVIFFIVNTFFVFSDANVWVFSVSAMLSCVFSPQRMRQRPRIATNGKWGGDICRFLIVFSCSLGFGEGKSAYSSERFCLCHKIKTVIPRFL